MVKRYKIFFGALVVAGLLLLGSCGWLLLTRSGALWLIGQAGSRGPVRLEVTSLQGSLLKGLELHGLRFSWPDGEASVDNLRVEASLAALLRKQLQIDLLYGVRVEVRLARPAPGREQAEWNLPDSEAALSALGGWSFHLAQLQIDYLRVDPGDGEKAELSQITAQLQGDARRLSLPRFQLVEKRGTWQGRFLIDAGGARMNGELGVKLARPVGTFESLAAKLALTRGSNGFFQGPVSLRGRAARATYNLAAELLLESKGLALHQLRLGRDDLPALIRGELTLQRFPEPGWQAALQLDGLDLEPELGQKMDLRGALDLAGDLESYTGHVSLRNRASDWMDLSLDCQVQGNTGQLECRELIGNLLGGDVSGSVSVDWREGLDSLFDLEGQKLQLEHLPEGPDGELSLALQGWLKKPAGETLQLGGSARISAGQVQGRDLRGEVKGAWFGGREVTFEQLDLAGTWGTLTASGDLREKLDLALDVRDAAALWPTLDGAGRLTGWLAWTGIWPHGQLKGAFENLRYKTWRIGALTGEGRQLKAGEAADLQLQLHQLTDGRVVVDDLALSLVGTPQDHQGQVRVADSRSQALLELTGSWANSGWRGLLRRLDLSVPNRAEFMLQQPVPVEVSAERLRSEDIQLRGRDGATLTLAGDWPRAAGERKVLGRWQNLDLALLGLWFDAVRFEGESSGFVDYRQDVQGAAVVGGQLRYSGLVEHQGQALRLEAVDLAGDWGPRGLKVHAELLASGGGKLTLQADSARGVEAAVPSSGHFELEFEAFPLGLLGPLLPAGQTMTGQLAGEAAGSWSAGERFEVTGQAGVESGTYTLVGQKNRLDFPFEQAHAHFAWQDELLQGSVSLGLGGGDGLAGDILLHLPPRWPLALKTPIPLDGELKIRLGQLGLLRLLVPEQVADLGGRVGGAVRLAGTLQNPLFSGDFQLTEGRMNLPRLGVVLDRIKAKALFDSQQIRLTEIALVSGTGQLSGRGEASLSGWNLRDFTIELQGDNVLIANLPEVRALASPRLTLSGNRSEVTVGGALKIPELQIINWHPAGPVARSDDVVYVDQRPRLETSVPLNLRLDLAVELGQRVVVKDRGLDVRLAGNIHLTRPPGQGVLGRGQIDIPEGHFSAYGVKLPLTSGHLYFSGGPVDNPTLDIIASKTFSEVTAGVSVSGTARRPEIRLISEPVMEDTDILSYIVLGRPTVGGASDLSALSLASAALLSTSDSVSLQQKLKNRSGLDVIDIRPGEEGTLESSVVTVGKYLTPELYLSYGRALASQDSQVQLRYSPTKRVDIESHFGEVSGADIYYRFEFD